ncbi:MAG: DnaA regulatory inactivator Hda [Colwellia sp.]|nr:DnaA regulatory inactivator Hda [Colwellia sp.]MCW9081487.1 DnaA regulatory inactivator Hda [Colwellia sp.]
MTDSRQLALSVQLPDDETFESYRSKGNQGVINQLSQFVEQKSAESTSLPKSFYLFGLSGVGKSHLLHASSAYAAKLGRTSVCLSCAELKVLPVDVLEGLEQIDLICLDDIHLIADNQIWQQAIFDLYNRVIEHNHCLLITGEQSASQLGLSLPDLVSRLSWGLTEQVKPLDDDEKVLVLQYRASQRGLMLSDDAAKFLLNRLSREMAHLLTSLDTLDKASIREQRKITIPFIKEVLKLS